MRMHQPLVIAHRGNSSVAPENTLAAFESAWRAGADQIELDIQMTSDGEAAVIHNDTLDETTSGSGPVAGISASELRSLDAGSWFSPSFAGQRVPLLGDVLDWMREREGIDLLLEFKGEWDAGPVGAVTEKVQASGLAARVVAQSFAVPTVRALRDVAPDLPRGLLISALEADTLALCSELGAQQLNPSGLLLQSDPTLLQRIREAGMQAMVWTANEPQHWAALRDLGADGIITDRPDRLRGFLDAGT